MLTKKGKYGLKALVHLARMPAGQLAFVGDIATGNNIPKKFLDAILGELRNAGFVQSRKGKEGGYRLARPADEIRVGHVVRVLDGPLAPIPCASRTQYQRCEDCNEATCQVRHLMLEVRQAIAEVLDQRSLAEMRDIADDLTIAKDADDLTIASGMSDLPVARDDLPVVAQA
ncbi:Rrf2 family transcriptional regulator [Mesorhizobium sp. B2-5-4]|uniref:RrF2 family transcriptional regulator n=1 Tax=Mesorhizobium sp. B2-5-4 TaxID=2589926 RepID=UPI0011278786|nr:Rrf2 family transcriptional regulator [Mesorhizobium sp. B2-5-4]TPK41381.1 Rrf2 family transcriptional regulator [Mesorhizobium sp. B2-5-4]